MRQTDIEAYAPAACVRRAPIRRFHDAAPTAGTDDKAACRRQAHGPFGDESRESARVPIVTSQGSVLLQPGGTKKNDRVLDLFAAKSVERLQVFSENSQRPCGIAADE